ncbi:MAG TPA: PA14 domain-containing protein [Candidatus Krumholzibacteria bacterium]|nr:PA14 domain-containing protein [Candidatus Krumholzibacteria bacterium]
MNKWAISLYLSALLVVSFGCKNNSPTQPNPSTVVVSIGPSSFTQGVDLVVTFDATITGATDNSLIWYVNGTAGGDSTTVGSISATGRYRAPNTVPSPATVEVRATSVEDPRASDAVQVTIVSGNGDGLPATYSNGTNVQEGPIFNGFSADCSSTNSNLYQGVCVSLSDSPVNWASGADFSVSWNGNLFIPYAGNYTFSSHHLVNGVVYITVNGTVVADLNTTGSDYSKTLTLPGNTWVPVYLSFETNGGSNSMIFGWTSPGGEWFPVERSYLKP